jgi:hypothetical protein
MLLSQNYRENCSGVSNPVALIDWRKKNEDFNKRNGDNGPGVYNNP